MNVNRFSVDDSQPFKFSHNYIKLAILATGDTNKILGISAAFLNWQCLLTFKTFKILF